MLVTRVYQKEYTAASYDVAHLYEHIVIHSFYKYLESHHIQPGLVGYIGGETFEGIIFLNTTFYDQHVADLYEEFLSKKLEISDALISHTLHELEAEDRINLIMRDKASLDQQLDSLVTASWVNNNLIVSGILKTSKLPLSPFETKKVAKDFRTVMVGVYGNNEDLDEDERILLLRLSAILGDILHVEMRQKLETFYVEDSQVMSDNEYIGSTYHFQLANNVSLQTIKNIAEKKLATFDIASSMPFITMQFNEFSKRSSWNDKVIDYYRYTGIITNNPYIASLATPKRTAALISKLKVHVRVIQEGVEDRSEDHQ